LRADERIAWVEEPSGLEASWKKLAAGSKASPKLWMDAYLAAFALAGGHQLVTTDKAFKQFKGSISSCFRRKADAAMNESGGRSSVPAMPR
jgi:predicted nucleic acid-binding protein